MTSPPDDAGQMARMLRSLAPPPTEAERAAALAAYQEMAASHDADPAEQQRIKQVALETGVADDPAFRPPQLYRVVDAHHQGWHPVGGGDGATLYSADYGFQREGLDDRTLGQLAATRGPLRPVLPITDADRDRLQGFFVMAGRKTVATLCAALETVFQQLRDAHGSSNPNAAYNDAWTHLRAGREGSWESEALTGLVEFGNDLNLTPRHPRAGKRGRTYGQVTDARKAGPGTRVQVLMRDEMAAMIYRWVTDPDRFTEVAETLAFAVSSYCDTCTGGWRAVADQWLQPGGLAHTTSFAATYRLLYSTSAHFDPGLIF